MSLKDYLPHLSLKQILIAGALTVATLFAPAVSEAASQYNQTVQKEHVQRYSHNGKSLDSRLTNSNAQTYAEKIGVKGNFKSFTVYKHDKPAFAALKLKAPIVAEFTKTNGAKVLYKLDGTDLGYLSKLPEGTRTTKPGKPEDIKTPKFNYTRVKSVWNGIKKSNHPLGVPKEIPVSETTLQYLVGDSLAKKVTGVKYIGISKDKDIKGEYLQDRGVLKIALNDGKTIWRAIKDVTKPYNFFPKAYGDSIEVNLEMKVTKVKRSEAKQDEPEGKKKEDSKKTGSVETILVYNTMKLDENIFKSDDVFDAKTSRYKGKFSSLDRVLLRGAKYDTRAGGERVAKLNAAWTYTGKEKRVPTEAPKGRTQKFHGLLERIRTKSNGTKEASSTAATKLFHKSEVMGRRNRRNANTKVKALLQDGVTLDEYVKIKAGLNKLENTFIDWTLRLKEKQSSALEKASMDYSFENIIELEKPEYDAFTSKLTELNIKVNDVLKYEKASFWKAVKATKGRMERSNQRYGWNSSKKWADRMFNPITISKSIWDNIRIGIRDGKPGRILMGLGDLYTWGLRPIKGEVGNKIFKWYNAGRAATAGVELGEAIAEGRPGTAAANFLALKAMEGKDKSNDPTRGLEGGQTTPTVPFTGR